MFAGGETAGYSLGASEPDVQRALIEYLQPGDVFYDVGANAGFHSLLGAKLVGPEGRVYCFEPLPKAVSVLRHNLDENGYANYEIIEAAVGESSGTARLTGPPGQLRAKLNEGAKSFLEVQLVSLDELGFRTPKLVKIDVEGAEKRVLEGMRSIMHEHRPVLVIEIHGLERPSVERILQESGYAFSVLNEDGMLHLIATGSAEASARRHPARDDSQA